MSTRIRIFKTAWFSKAARKAGIDDAALREAVQQAARGQVVDLGGGVFKKRLNQNRHRAIVLTRVADQWVLEYVFAKQDRANIARDELQAFRQLAALYERYSDEHIQTLIDNGDWLELR